MTTDPETTGKTDTHRRAELRGRESVARWRIESAVWAGRLFAVVFAVATIAPMFKRGGPDWLAIVILGLISAAVLVATQLVHDGSRGAAVALLALFVAAKLGAWQLGGDPLSSGLLWSVIFIGAFANGIWGTFSLAAVRSDAALAPPME
jgi:hypothetical protein